MRNHFLLITVFALLFSGCISHKATVNATRITPTVQQELNVTAFIGIQKNSNPLIQSDVESKEGFIVRIAATKIISERPFLIALSQMESKENLWQGVSPEVKDIEKCWMFDTDSMKQCTDEDIQNIIGNQKSPQIFFAFIYSNSVRELFVLDYRYPPVEQDVVDLDMHDMIDGYRLVIELQDGKWVEKSLTQVY